MQLLNMHISYEIAWCMRKVNAILGGSSTNIEAEDSGVFKDKID